MKYNKQALLDQLTAESQELIVRAEHLRGLGEGALNARPGEGKWSALECIEHLNLVGLHYLKELDDKISTAPKDAGVRCRGSWFGNLSANRMLPDTAKMTTFDRVNPIGSTLKMDVIDRFIQQQLTMQEFHQRATEIDMAGTKIQTMAKWVKFRMCDAFRFISNHGLRHMLQAERAAGLAETS